MEPCSLILGERDNWGRQIPFGISRLDRRQHLFVIGQTGTGKSTLKRELLRQDIEAGEGCALIDPHGDLADELLDLVPSHRVDDVVILDPSDLNHPVALNPFYQVPQDERPLVTANLVATFKHLWRDSWGARLEYILSNTIAAVLEAPDHLRPSLLSVPRILVERTYREAVLRHVHDPRVRSFFADEFAQWNERFLAEALSPVQNKIGAILRPPVLRNILCQWRPTIDLSEIMEQRRILIVKLTKGVLGEEPANLLGSLVATGIQHAAMRRATIAEKDRIDFHLYIDEFHNFTTDTFASGLSELRKYALTLTLGGQYLDQTSEEVLTAIFGNVGSMIAFRVSANDAEVLARQIGTYTERTFRDLGRGRVCAQILTDGEVSDPFLGTTHPPKQISFGQREKILTQCRQRYSRHRADVEANIGQWLTPRKKKKPIP